MHARTPVASAVSPLMLPSVSPAILARHGATANPSLQPVAIPPFALPETVPKKQILRMKGLTVKLGVSRSAVYDWLDCRSPRFKPDFPRPFKLTPKLQGGAIGWLESDVDAWIERQRTPLEPGQVLPAEREKSDTSAASNRIAADQRKRQVTAIGGRTLVVTARKQRSFTKVASPPNKIE